MEEELEERIGDVSHYVDQQIEHQIDEQLTTAKLELQDFARKR